tara:strand:+ start:262 stop:888 length:627 start_codon:yes stop_codon:yes gene_type:complete
MNIKIIDNFLKDQDFSDLCSLNINTVERDKVKVYHNTVHDNGQIKNDCINKDTLNRLVKNYNHKALELLKELNPKKVDLYEYAEFNIIETGADYKFPIHDDTPNKLLSGVIYLKPEKNSGTIFYDNKKGKGKKEIEWKPNRAVFFSRSEKETWHSYEGDGVSNRLALVYNLMTNDIKGVCKAENKIYFFTKFRFLINPYLHKYFKFTI